MYTIMSAAPAPEEEEDVEEVKSPSSEFDARIFASPRATTSVREAGSVSESVACSLFVHARTVLHKDAPDRRAASSFEAVVHPE